MGQSISNLEVTNKISLSYAYATVFVLEARLTGNQGESLAVYYLIKA